MKIIILLCAAFFLITTFHGLEAGEQHRRYRRNVLDFAGMIECVTGRQAFDYLNYGCYCGLGGSGAILDGVDRCCYRHDNCYKWLRETGICSIFQLYFSGYDHRCSKCASSNKNCSRGLCHCDRDAAHCFKRNKYNKRLKNVFTKKCV